MDKEGNSRGHILVVVVDLPDESMTTFLEAPEVMFSMRIVIPIEVPKGSHAL